jgi:hypothetical protein
MQGMLEAGSQPVLGGDRRCSDGDRTPSCWLDGTARVGICHRLHAAKGGTAGCWSGQPVSAEWAAWCSDGARTSAYSLDLAAPSGLLPACAPVTVSDPGWTHRTRLDWRPLFGLKLALWTNFCRVLFVAVGASTSDYGSDAQSFGSSRRPSLARAVNPSSVLLRPGLRQIG